MGSEVRPNVMNRHVPALHHVHKGEFAQRTFCCVFGGDGSGPPATRPDGHNPGCATSFPVGRGRRCAAFGSPIYHRQLFGGCRPAIGDQWRAPRWRVLAKVVDCDFLTCGAPAISRRFDVCHRMFGWQEFGPRGVDAQVPVNAHDRRNRSAGVRWHLACGLNGRHGAVALKTLIGEPQTRRSHVLVVSHRIRFPCVGSRPESHKNPWLRPLHPCPGGRKSGLNASNLFGLRRDIDYKGAR